MRALAVVIVLLSALPAEAAQTGKACALDALRTMDDGISPANVIADALAEVCMTATSPSCSSPECLDAARRRFSQMALPEVLRARAKARP